jgi:transcriptional regulator with XRE-family HTH domain
MRDDLARVLRSIAANIRLYRRRQRLTQDQLAEMSDIDIKYLQRVEAAKRSLSLGVLVKIAAALKTTPAALLRRARLPRARPGRPKKI